MEVFLDELMSEIQDEREPGMQTEPGCCPHCDGMGMRITHKPGGGRVAEECECVFERKAKRATLYTVRGHLRLWRLSIAGPRFEKAFLLVMTACIVQFFMEMHRWNELWRITPFAIGLIYYSFSSTPTRWIQLLSRDLENYEPVNKEAFLKLRREIQASCPFDRDLQHALWSWYQIEIDLLENLGRVSSQADFVEPGFAEPGFGQLHSGSLAKRSADEFKRFMKSIYKDAPQEGTK